MAGKDGGQELAHRSVKITAGPPPAESISIVLSEISAQTGDVGCRRERKPCPRSGKPWGVRTGLVSARRRECLRPSMIRRSSPSRAGARRLDADPTKVTPAARYEIWTRGPGVGGGKDMPEAVMTPVTRASLTAPSLTRDCVGRPLSTAGRGPWVGLWRSRSLKGPPWGDRGHRGPGCRGARLRVRVFGGLDRRG